jgi:hypothetical protein
MNFMFTRYIVRVIEYRSMRWAVHVTRMWDRRDKYRAFMETSDRKSHLGRPKREW